MIATVRSVFVDVNLKFIWNCCCYCYSLSLLSALCPLLSALFFSTLAAKYVRRIALCYNLFFLKRVVIVKRFEANKTNETMYGQRTEPLFIDRRELGAPNEVIEKYTSDSLIRAILEKWELKVPNHETSKKTLAYWTTINEATRKEFLDLFNSDHSKVKTILGDSVCMFTRYI